MKKNIKKKLLFSKIHYWGLFSLNFKTDIFSDLLKIQNKDWFIYYWNYQWYLSDLIKTNIEWVEYIFWRLNKVIPNEENVSVDKHTKEEKRIINKDIKDNESTFIIYPQKHLIWFQASKTLTKNQFFSSLKTWYNSAGLNPEPEFDLIFDEKFLLEMLDNFSKVSYARFDLKTTNPDSREDFKEIDDLFQATNSETNQLYLKPKSWDSLEFRNKKSLVRQWLSMSASWYWWWTINGYDLSWNPYTIRTGDNNLKEIEIEDTWTEDEITKKIIFTFQTLINNSN